MMNFIACKRIHKKNILFFLLLLGGGCCYSATVRGTITDTQNKETLIGATIEIVGTTKGAVTDFTGEYLLEKLNPGTYTFRVSYISYESKEIKNIVLKEKEESLLLDIELEPADVQMEEVVVTARKNRESENILLEDRRLSTVAVENLGAREMSVKGISNVADGVKKITGISMSGSNQVFVRGLGDRYSATSLNGLAIASPNPDNKLIPLYLFPSSVVKNITVNKIYQASSFGDYAGAHINIETKENAGKNFFSVTLSTGGKLNTIFSDFYSSDKNGLAYLGYADMSLSQQVKDMKTSEFREYILKKDPFKTSFSIRKETALPEINIGLSGGRSWNLVGNPLNVMASANFSNDYSVLKNAYVSTITAQGVLSDSFHYDEYTYETTASALARVDYTIMKNSHFFYNLFYVNSSEDNYRRREGVDAEGINLIGSNSIYRNYSLLNNQFSGSHLIMRQWAIDWNGAYTKTNSEEPDRKQVMFKQSEDGSLSLFKLNQQETMRFFGDLNENEWIADLKLKYLFRNKNSEQNFFRIGGAFRDKERDYFSTNFYYNLKNLDPVISGIYNADAYLNRENIENGTVTVTKRMLSRNKYFAGSRIYAAFVDTEYYPLKSLLLSLGIRYERSSQWVRYWMDDTQERLTELNADDFFPALNLKYTLNEKNNLRIGLSRTVTRPSFVEMAPFEYKESYGGAAVRGYADIQNGYNYNIDLRYEFYPESSALISVSFYYKYLDNPIERVQEYSGAAIHSFRNVEKGEVAGVELEMKKTFAKVWKAGLNASYIYTRIELPKDGVYTDKKRELQGASPYLLNADVTYTPTLSGDRNLVLSLIYNLRGPRIYTVGINGVGNVVEEAFNTLDFVGSYSFDKRWQAKLQAKNLINQKQQFTQEITSFGKSEVVEYYRKGVGVEVGVVFNF